jgi:O-antigen/teichoic acid export membrane protein
MSEPQLPGPLQHRQPITFQGEFSKKLLTNTFFNFVGRFWSFLLTLLLTPYILSHLSVSDFGTWVVLSIFINSFNLLDFGLGSSFVKHVSEYYTHEDYRRINGVVFSGFLFYILFGIVQVSLGLLLEEPLFQLFHISGASEPYRVVLLSCAVSNFTSMLLSVVKGIQRMDKSNSLEIKISIVNALGTVLFLAFGWGMLGLAVNALATTCFALFLTWWTLRRIMPKISIQWHFDGKLLREMFAYGIKMQVSQVGGLISFRLDKLIVSRFLGIAAVSFYEVSSRLTSFMRALPLVMVSALIPATSELGARNDRTRILQTYLLASKYVAMIAVAMAAFLVLEARAVLTFWLGPGFENSVILVQILAIGYGANVLGGVASQTGAGVGRPEFDMRSTVLLSVSNPILSIALVQWFGATGAAAGTTIAFIIATSYLVVSFHRNYIRHSVGPILQFIYIRPIVAGIFANVATLAFHQVAPQFVAWETVRYMAPLKIATDFGIFAPTYILLLVAFRQVTAIDWNNFVGVMSFGFEFLRHPLRGRVKIYR